MSERKYVAGTPGRLPNPIPLRAMNIRTITRLLCFTMCMTVGIASAQDVPTQRPLTPEEAYMKLESLGLVKDHVITSRDVISQIEANNVEAIQLFLAAGVNPNFKDVQGRYPLMVASEAGYTDIVKALLDAGADVSVKDRFGRTPLVVAASHERDAVFQMLVAANAKR